ncbi:MAG: 23S rRNA (guanosine(2251)-2'-O)-methyltransferase RlmB [Clostridia bacterium]|nr:23S rRNA (guanosine(2251)-2'-O)-methyltransferase RlmB [Clostridia bacterium]
MQDNFKDQNEQELVYGRNSVLEALRSGRSINKILYCGDLAGSMGTIFTLARDRNIIVTKVPREKLDLLTDGKNHQGVLLYLSSAEYSSVDDILGAAEASGEEPFIIILDEIQDAGNFGAIIRTADAVGAHGIIIPKRRSVPLTAAVAKASSGAVNYVKIARVTNIHQEILKLKERGIWIAGTDMSGTVDFCDADLNIPLAVVIGSEGSGMSRIVKDCCDLVLSIPMKGKVSSLNASVAAGVVLYEAFRQKNSAGRK